MPDSRGFVRCGDCEGGGWEPLPPFDGTVERTSKPCPSCSGSGLVPTEKLRREAREGVIEAYKTGGSFAAQAEAVLAKVAEHLGDRE